MRIAHVELAHQLTDGSGRLLAHRRGRGHLAGEVAEVGQVELSRARPAVGVRRGAHPQVALGVCLAHERGRGAGLVEQLLGAVGLQPRVEDGEVLVVALDARQRHLVRAPRAGDLGAVDLVGAGPALGRAQHDERPAGPGAVPVATARRRLDLLDASVCRRQRPGETLVHAGQVLALDLEHLVAVALEQTAHLGGVLASEDGRAGDLVAVEVQDRQDGTVARGVEEGDALPRALERARLGLTVADDGEREQVGVVHHRTEGVDEDVAELTALVDRPGRRDGDVARYAARRGELAEEPSHAGLVERDVRGRSRCRCPRGSRRRREPGRRGRGR